LTCGDQLMGAHGHVDHALANRGELARLVACHQRRARIQLDVDAAIGALAHLVGPDLAALAPRERGPSTSDILYSDL
jgi:hypothetical protein